jgi:UDP-N-acetylmuramoyl-L-alanyl-D-glutamate--2,6-diaminopimelate ligase
MHEASLRLTELVDRLRGEGLAATVTNGAASNPSLSGVAADSRRMQSGALFVAIPGTKTDGRAFIADALAKGAAALLVPEGTATEAAVPVVAVSNVRRAYAVAAAAIFGAQPPTIAAVTGTNGKTSVAVFTQQIWTALGRSAGSLGTLGLDAPKVSVPGALTTPDPETLHRFLADLAAQGVTHLAMEASSHGIDQHRLDGVRLSAAGFTNFSRDHLDYHGSEETYFTAKARLFETLLPEGKIAVLNADIPQFEKLTSIARDRGLKTISYGWAGKDITLNDLAPLPDGQRLRVTLFGKTRDLTVPLIGAFQAANALCALGLAIACGEAPEKAIETLPKLAGVRGRMEIAAYHPSGAPVFVDYAHTPDGLLAVLTALRPHVRRRLLIVFGCGGDRDKGKRPLMGAVACRLADQAIVTDDNPRSEEAAAIRAAILAGCPPAAKQAGVVEEIGDRALAIRRAVARLEAGDVLVIAGKGHEQGQIVGATVIPFDDANEARKAVKEAA